MAFSITTNESLNKEGKYRLLLNQIDALIESENNIIANLGNTASALKYSMDNFLWTGFYLTENENELVLGPFQGRVACTRIKFGEGVCGAAAERRETVIVHDVDKFPGHIVCDSMSRSEIVVPIIKEDKTLGALDIDSDILSNFDDTDKFYLEKIVQKLLKIF
ncbi:MAG: Free methionine-R-sulfoxide reductase [Ignavibacteria bacterium]|nr:Free methionine-R-sulfoxide reductase [Ignavibacteria bacterium]